MRHLSRSLTCAPLMLAALVLISCQAASTASPSTGSNLTGEQGTTPFGVVADQQGAHLSALGVWTVAIDPSSMSATATVDALRSGQANDDVYQLSIDNFLRPDSLTITDVSGTASTLDLTYEVAHPFPAPADPAGAPNGSSNRADLGITGMALFLVDVPSASGNTYFTDRVANTSLVTNADAFYAPAGLIATTTTANVFPYKLLVDEAGPDGNRVGITNGGEVTGNYGTDGWTRAEFGANNDAWTGYGVLHGGQRTRTTISLDKTALSTSGFSFDVALIAKYNDPRGGTNSAQKRANRLPGASADPTAFAYRMPHGALDVATIRFAGESGGFIPNTISSSTLRFHLVDWDARAAETGAADLSDDLTVTNVAVGESGLPSLAVCIPGAIGDSTTVDVWDPALTITDDDTPEGGDPGLDTGIPGDALYFTKSVTNTLSSGQTPGLKTGLVRATDPEVGVVIPLDGTTLTPLAANLPEPITYQAFSVQVGSPNVLPTGDWAINGSGVIADGGTVTVSVNNVVDPDSGTFDVQVDWDNGAGFVTVAAGLPIGAGPFGPYASPVYTLANPTVTEFRTLDVRLVDGVSALNNLANNPGNDTVTINPASASSCNAPAAGSNITTAFAQSFTSATNLFGFTAAIGLDSGGAGCDIATFRDPAYPGYVMGDKGAVRDIYRISHAATPIATPMTSGNLGGALTGQNIYDIEIDSTNRVLFCSRTSTWHITAIASKYQSAGGGGGANVNIRYFDYSGSPVAAIGGTISTGTARVANFCLGPNDDIYTVDTNNVLHHYVKASAYAENVTAPFPVDLAPTVGLTSGSGAAMRRVDDIVYNWHNQAFYVLIQNNVLGNAAGTIQNGFLHRFNCDGTSFGPPLAWQINDSTRGAWESQGDILLDQFNASGGAISAADKQILILSENRSPGQPDMWVVNSDLVVTGSINFANDTEQDARVTGAIGLDNRLMTRKGTNENVAFYDLAPLGWQ